MTTSRKDRSKESFLTAASLSLGMIPSTTTLSRRMDSNI